MMRKGVCMAALGALLISGAAVAAEETDAAAPVPGMSAAPGSEPAGGESAGARIERRLPGADALPGPMAGEGAVALPEGNGTNVEAPAEDRAADEAPPASPEGALPAPGEDAGSRI